jgi:hypothetical protein
MLAAICCFMATVVAVLLQHVAAPPPCPDDPTPGCDCQKMITPELLFARMQVRGLRQLVSSTMHSDRTGPVAAIQFGINVWGAIGVVKHQ